MSDLQKAWAKNRLGSMPAETFDEREEEEADTVPEMSEHFDDDSSSASSASSASSTGTVIPSPSQNLFARAQGVPRGRTFQPIPWTTYFERELFLHDETSPQSPRIHAYLTSPVGQGPLFVMHHGGGSSGLSFAVVGDQIRKRLPSAGVFSLDARGHGSTTTIPEGQAVDLSLETLASDLSTAIQLTRREMKWAELPPIVLVGHSMGGAVVTELARSGRLGGAVLGLAVLDVVEGSAIDALQHMHTYLSTRPTGFPTLEAGIEWHTRSRTIRNSLSARTSVPSLLRRREGKPGDTRPWKWRTDLAATKPYWENWFVGLSGKFLAARGGKLLLLAGTDRLDTELTIGQMQGKYNLQVFPEAGHFIHEDLPEKIAISLVDFYRRNDRTALVLPPKVSELLKRGEKV
ncbi:Alpha/Beta hydrolase protein [Xylaria castorea]|nr:Alpha/Beta hydrolase protein [Xylaria castorea]